MTPTRQQAAVGEGLALGCIALGVEQLRYDRFRVELAFRQAWRQWPSSSRFPQIRVDLGRSHIMPIVIKSPRRSGSVAAWSRGRVLTPYLTGVCDGVEDAADILKVSCGVELVAWARLAREFTRLLGAPAIDDSQ
ncbi:hypothetical protein ACPZ19_38960 [Amycolatopsis lurida]